MPLSDTKIRNSKPKDKQYRIYDTGGLFLIVAPSGGKWWRFKYRFEGKQKLISMGTYPEITLAKARERRDKARRQVAEGVDPSQVPKGGKIRESQ